MSRRSGLVALTVVVAVLAVGGNAWIALSTEGRLSRIVHEESVQRVHTIGERCETTLHELKIISAALPPTDPEVVWFGGSYHKCLKSLAKVEARAGVTYRP